jgi:hypothetical protein
MKKFILVVFFCSVSLFGQNEKWLELINNADVSVLTPQNKNYASMKEVKVNENSLSIIKEYGNEKLKVVLSFLKYHNFIELNGEIINKDDEDLVVTLRINFPVKFSNGYWNNDLNKTLQISSAIEYNNYVEMIGVPPPDGAFNKEKDHSGGYSDKVGRGQISFYPLASVNIDGMGYGWGVDMGLPIIYRLNFETDRGITAEFDLGISKETKKFPNRSFFKMQLFNHDVEWNFRSALSKYYEINAIYFKKRVEFEGIWLPFTQLNTIDEFEDFGFAFHETFWGSSDPGLENKSTIEADRIKNVYSFQYTEPWDIQIPIKKLDATYEEVIGRETVTSKDSAYLYNSATLDSRNKFHARRLNTPWFETGWAVSITTNVDPELQGYNRYQYVRDTEIDPAIKMNVDGIYFDSMEWNWHNDLNYNRSHFITTDYPLTFSSSLVEPKPAIWNYSSEYEMMKKIADEMHLKGKLTMGNGFNGTPFAAGILDLFGAEFNWNRPSDYDRLLLQNRRAISFRKPIVFLLNEGMNEEVFTKPPFVGYQQYFERLAVYGFFPSFFSTDASSDPYWQDKNRYESGRPFFKKYIPIIKSLASAGWEPITLAKTNSNIFQLERFGDDLSEGIFYTIFNESESEEENNITIDNLLNIGSEYKIDELIDGGNYKIENNRIDFTIGSKRAKIFKITK